MDAAMPRPKLRNSTWSVQDAKNRFSAVMEAAKREPQTVTKHGKPAVVMVDAAEFERLRQLQRARIPSFVELLLSIPKGEVEFERIHVVPRDVEF
jgi:prevent-host-death family protein